MRQKEKAKRRAEHSRRMEPGQPRRKKQKIEEESYKEDAEQPNEVEQEKRRIPPGTPTKRKVGREEKEKRTPKRRRQNGDMRRYISCKKWREEEESDILLGMGSRLDTTSPAVTVKEPMLPEEEAKESQVLDQKQHHQPSQDHHQSSQDQQGGQGGHHHHHLSAVPDGRKAVTPACKDRMPGPIVQASQGGTSPRTINIITVSNNHHIREEQEMKETAQQESRDNCSQEDILLGMGSRLDTTSPAVTVKEAMEEYEVRESKDRGQQHLSQDQQEGEEPRSNAEDHQHHHHLGHDHQHSSQDQHEGTGEQHHHHLSADHDGREAVRSACNNRMPGPIVQASPGGTSPRTLNNL